jgi:serine/threonine-protein kinase
VVPDDLTAEEQREFRALQNSIIATRFRLGLPAAMILTALIGTVGLLSRTGVDRTRIVLCAVAAELLLLASIPLSRMRGVQGQPLVLLVPLATMIVVCMGLAVMQLPYGLENIGSIIAVLAAIYCAVVTPLPAGPFVLFALWLDVVMFSVIWFGSRDPGPAHYWIAINVCVDALLAVGLHFHERTERASFLARRRLDEVHRRLAESEASLAKRVDAQVEEIVRRAAEVEALNAQLQVRVQERSRELAVALARIAERAQPSTGGLRPGDVLGGRARIEYTLAAGGMGEVYLAQDLVSGRRVAAKVIRSSVPMDKAFLFRFLTEAAAAATIQHSGVVKPLHVDVTEDGQLYQLLDYVEGSTLAAVLARSGPLPVAAAARLGAALAEILAAAHDAGVIHRDVKPSNLMVSQPAPAVRILDFGLSKWSGRGEVGLTSAGQILGTPLYMSPEQLRDPMNVATSTDVYSLGVVIYEMVSGSLPFDARLPGELIAAHTTGKARPLHVAAGATPAALAELVASCLELDPSARPAARTLAPELTRIADAHAAPSLERVAAQLLRLPSREEAAFSPTISRQKTQS